MARLAHNTVRQRANAAALPRLALLLNLAFLSTFFFCLRFAVPTAAAIRGVLTRLARSNNNNRIS